MKPIIEINNLSKKYQIGMRQPYYSFRDTLAGLVKNPLVSFRKRKVDKGGLAEDEFWALKDVSFKVYPSEVIGIIGRNGAGKTTLLKLLSQITPPTRGEIILRGRVASLLEVGTGFHPELTGRENIYLNGAILGMKRREIRKKFDEIVDFAEVEKFLDASIKHYSSGMYTRLAFSVAAHLEPEILLIDEVLAVGDTFFQKKCLGKMEKVAKEGRTILFVSHNMTAILSLCRKAYLLELGKILQSGTAESVVNTYIQKESSQTLISFAKRKDRQGTGLVRVKSLKIKAVKGASNFIKPDDELEIIISYQAKEEFTYPRFVIGIYDYSGVTLFRIDSDITGCLPSKLPLQGTVICKTSPLNLSPGKCSVNIAVYRSQVIADYIIGAATFNIESSDYFGTGKIFNRQASLYLLKNTWSFSRK